MPLERTYSKTDVRTAIDLAEGSKFSSFTSVWGGNDSHYGPARDIVNGEGEFVKTLPGRYQPPKAESETVSGDEGHTKRNHVKGSQASEYVGVKSRFDDMEACLGASAEVLNSVKGQAALKAMDDDPSIRDRKIRCDLTGSWYGDAGDNVKKKINNVTLIVMRLGTDTLWMHTSYPTGFV